MIHRLNLERETMEKAMRKAMHNSMKVNLEIERWIKLGNAYRKSMRIPIRPRWKQILMRVSILWAEKNVLKVMERMVMRKMKVCSLG